MDNSIVKFAIDQWPSVALVGVFLGGAGTMTAAILSGHGDQALPIVTLAGVVVVGLGTLFKLDQNREAVAKKIEDAKTEVVVKQASAETKIDQARETAAVAAIKVEDARQETVSMLGGQNEVLGEIRKQTNGGGPMAHLVGKVDQLTAKVDSHGRILETLTQKLGGTE